VSRPLLVRRVALTAHVVASVGWLGSVAAFLALAIAAVTSADPQVVRGASVGMGIVAWAVILPLDLAAVASGIAVGLVSPWGLLRHYWVVVKLGLTVLATAFLLLHLPAVSAVAAPGPVDPSLRSQLVFDAVAALLILAVNTGLSVFKPAGVTPYGWRKQWSERPKP
jgi:hypothetical protein